MGKKDEKKKNKKNKNKGYIVEVHLEYPKELHKLHNDYPFAPEKLAVKSDWLSPYQKDVRK